MENQEAYQKAKKRVEAKLGFYIHLIVYLVVNIALIIFNFIHSPQKLWFQWPLMGWSIGIFFHGMGVFVFSGRSAVTEKMIKKEMEREALKRP